SPDFNFGIFHAAAREGGFVHGLAAKAGMTVELQGLSKMPPAPPAADAPNIADTPKKFKQLADWLTTQMEDRALRSIVDLRGRPIPDWNLPVLARAESYVGACGETPPAILDTIDEDFKLNDVKMFG